MATNKPTSDGHPDKEGRADTGDDDQPMETSPDLGDVPKQEVAMSDDGNVGAAVPEYRNADGRNQDDANVDDHTVHTDGTASHTDDPASDGPASDDPASDDPASDDDLERDRLDNVGSTSVDESERHESATHESAARPEPATVLTRVESFGPIRRVREWYQRPWTRQRKIRFFLGTLPALVIPTVIMLFTTQFFSGGTPGGTLVWADNTPTGGDFGAHVWGPAYLRDHVFPSGWYNGWSMDWYAGLPAYRFYMVVPAVMMLIADIVLPYGVAMKLVSILGVVTIPAMCWAFGRLANFRYPLPELFAFAGLAFVLDESWSIYGGNLKSTMAGEFSFSIALSLAILGLGLFAYGLQTGRRKTTAAVVLSIAAVSHGLVLIFVALALVVTSVVWVLTTRGVKDADTGSRVKYIAFVGVTMVMLSAWWVLPFVANHDYMTDMKYTPEPSGASFNSFWEMYFPLTPALDILLTALALAGFYFGIVRNQINVVAIAATYFVLAALVAITSRWGLPLLGLLWNPRLLPFFYLCRNMLVAFGAYELMLMLYNYGRKRFAHQDVGVGPATAFGAVFNIAVLVVLGFMYQIMIPGVTGTRADTNSEGESIQRYYMGPIQATDTNTRALGAAWARYNFTGYEGRSSWDEYRSVVNTMANLGAEYGCGRAQWENHQDNGQYGTTMALMLLPYWTDSCIGSMEGLFFEASGTTPYHFLSTAAMSESSSNPVRGLRYTNTDANVGVEELQALGVKYTMLRSQAAKANADQHPELTRLADSGPWTIYLVADSDVVVPLAVQPVVVNERGGDRRERLLEIGTSWFQHQDEWAAMPATDGPDNWQHIDVAVDQQSREITDGRQTKVDIVKPVDEIRVIEPPIVDVSNVEIGNQSLSFDVSEIGTPVEVKVSYFPNWRAEGADGPYRIGPNMMVVVPTDTHVELTYGRTWLDYFSVLLTLLGIGLAIIGYRQGDIAMRRLRFGAYRERLELAGVLPLPGAEASTQDPDDPQHPEPGIAGDDDFGRLETTHGAPEYRAPNGHIVSTDSSPGLEGAGEVEGPGDGVAAEHAAANGVTTRGSADETGVTDESDEQADETDGETLSGSDPAQPTEHDDLPVGRGR